MANCFRMHVLGSFTVMALFSAAAIGAPPPQGQDQNKDAAPHPLAWAYAGPENPLPPPPPIDETAVKQIPGSTQSFTMKQIRDTGNPVDWFPGDHPPMPSIVAHRRSPGANPWTGSCGVCPYPTRQSRHANAP